MPILLGEIFAGYYGHRLPATAPYRTLRHLARRPGPRRRPGGLGRAVRRLRDAHAGRARATGWSRGTRHVETFALPDEITTGRRRTGALPPHHRQHRAAGRVRATAVLADRSPRRRLRRHGVGSGPPRSPAWSRWSACSSTRCRCAQPSPRPRPPRTCSPSCRTRYNDTLDHQHTSLSEIHRVTGHGQLFDTLFAYENYPVDAAALAERRRAGHHRHRRPGIHPLSAGHAGACPARHDASRRIRHRRVRRRADVEHVDRALPAGAGGDDRRSRGVRCRRWSVLDDDERAELDEWGNRAVLSRARRRGLGSGLFAEQVARARECGGAGVWRSRR